MNQANLQLGRTTQSDLERVIEPLASFISASDQPKAMLASALAILFGEMAETHRAAIAQVANWSGSLSS